MVCKQCVSGKKHTCIPFRLTKLEEFLQEKERVNWLVEGLLPNIGWTLLYGVRGVGKSTFVLQLCDALQLGKQFLGKRVKQTDILYIQADSVADEFRAIVQRVAPKITGWTCISVPERALGQPSCVSAMYDIVQKVKPGFVVFDSFYNLSHEDINTTKALVSINTMKGICKIKRGESILELPWLLIHHPPHDVMRASGHNSIGGNCSNEWCLLASKLSIRKGRVVKTTEISLSRDENGLWVYDEENELDDFEV